MASFFLQFPTLCGSIFLNQEKKKWKTVFFFLTSFYFDSSYILGLKNDTHTALYARPTSGGLLKHLEASCFQEHCTFLPTVGSVREKVDAPTVSLTLLKTKLNYQHNQWVQMHAREKKTDLLMQKQSNFWKTAYERITEISFVLWVPHSIGLNECKNSLSPKFK
jgi:hypothetical protein